MSQGTYLGPSRLASGAESCCQQLSPQPRLAIPQASDPKADILIVDDLDLAVRFLTNLLESAGYQSIRGQTNPYRALSQIQLSPPDLVVLDLHMPGTDGMTLLGELNRMLPREERPAVLVVTADQSFEAKRRALTAGAHDFVSKPFDTIEVLLRIRNLLEIRSHRVLLTQRVCEKTREIAETRDIALATLARLADSRDPLTGSHLERIAGYCQIIASALLGAPGYPEVDAQFVEQIERSSSLHDIGKVAIPDEVLMKTGPLTPAERDLMQSHALIGGDTLARVIASFPGHTFLAMAAEIAYQHHERWDGSGYPRGLAGKEISLAARIVSIADAYDAITSARPYKSASSHGVAVARIARDSGSHFDPHLVTVFLEVADEFAALQGAAVASATPVAVAG